MGEPKGSPYFIYLEEKTMVKSTKKALVICMAAAMMMSSVTGCSGGGAKADASPTTEAVTEAK